MIAFIDDHREAHGVEPICKVLPIAPSTYHAHPIAGKMPGAESAGKRLAVHARQLALEPNLQILRRHRRPLLRRLEQAHRSALADHVHRTAPIGLCVMISES